MKTIILSDHTGDMIAMGESRRRQEYAEAQSEYQGRLKRRNGTVQKAHDSALSAYEREIESWNGKNWGQKFAYGLSKSVVPFLLCIAVMGAGVFAFMAAPEVWALWLITPAALVFMVVFFPSRKPREPSRERLSERWPEPTRSRQPVSSDEQRVWQAGNEGERRVSAHLSRRLNDDWTLLSGYRGPGGEIDQILVGPLGVGALEIKYLNGTVFVNGDDWKLDKYDNYGNLVESGEWVEDRGGRSPSAQVNEAVKPLEASLTKRKLVGKVNRAVILAHDKSKLGQVERQTVGCISTLRDLSVESLFPRSGRLDGVAAANIVQRVRQDHEYHKGQRKRRSRPRQSVSGRRRSARRR